MTKKRNRTRPALTLQERLNKFTQEIIPVLTHAQLPAGCNCSFPRTCRIRR